MARIRPLAGVSTLVVVGLFLGFGTWWIYRPVYPVEPPQFFSDDFPVRADDDLRNKEMLKRFEETPMRAESVEDEESYRMILFPTFDHPILVRASRTAKGSSLTTKLLDGMGGYDNGRLFITEERPLTEAEWLHLMELLESSLYWSLQPGDPTDQVVNDGAVWILESRHAEMLHKVVRITPKPQLLETLKYFLRLAGREAEYKGYWS